MPSGPRPQPPDLTMRVTFEGHYADTGHPWANVMHAFAPGSTLSLGGIATLAQFFGTEYDNAFMTLQPLDAIRDRVRVALRQSGVTIIGEYFTPAAGSSGVGGPLPQNCSPCISWVTGISYRGGHARTYLPMISGSHTVSEALLTTSYANSLAAGATTFLNHVNAHTTSELPALVLGTIAFQRHNAWLTPPIFEPFVGLRVRPFIRTQRRRIEP